MIFNPAPIPKRRDQSRKEANVEKNKMSEIKQYMFYKLSLLF